MDFRRRAGEIAKVCLHHASQAIIGRPAHNASPANAGPAARNFPDLARHPILNSTTKPDTARRGRLLILVRNVAASARPGECSEPDTGISARNNCTSKMNAAPKASGDRTSF